jgi:diguanylate cyclase
MARFCLKRQLLKTTLILEIQTYTHAHTVIQSADYENIQGAVIAILLVLLLAVIVVIGRDDLKQRRLERALADSEKKYRDLALRDPLTGLYNRAGLQAWVSETMGAVMVHGSGLPPNDTDAPPLDAATGALVYIDLDNFKPVNDAWGHKTGDEVLQIFGSRLKGFALPNVCVARLGGDEFVIAVAGKETPSIMHRLVPGLKAVLAERCIIGDRSFFLTASCGIAWYPNHGGNFHELLQNVDAAMYRAKSLGRDRFVTFAYEMRKAIQNKLDIQQGIRHSIERNELELHYQPRVDLATGEIAGYEALVRWHHPERGLLLPGEFLAAAEECGLITHIGEWVLNEACRFSTVLANTGFSARQISVNISGNQLCCDDFEANVLGSIHRHHIDSGRIMLEVNEHSLNDVVDSAIGSLGRLRAQGIPICLDGFGSLSSPLNYLRNLPIDILKVDRCCTADLGKTPGRKCIYEDIIHIAHKLGIEVVAEGVETDCQEQLLRELGCNGAQGYLTGRPMSADRVLMMEFARRAEALATGE